MDDAQTQLLETYRAEALSIFAVNQAGRAAAERVGASLLTVVGITAAVGINARTDVVLLPLAPISLLLLSYMFQQYGEVSVTGAARQVLEERVQQLTGSPALIYELAVAPVRKRRPLVGSVRLLQMLSVAVLASVVATGAVVAFNDRRWYETAGFVVGTLVAAASAFLSYRDMLRSGEVASRQIREALSSAGGRGTP